MIFCERLPSLKRFYKEGREEVLEQGRQRGRLEALRQAIVEVLVERFPQFVRLTKEKVALIEDPDVLGTSWSKEVSR
jgi:flagellar biosynthesis/type III secretory pathway protein FliH